MQHTDDQSLIQEIEEDIQRQRFSALWKRLGPIILVSVTVLVLGTAALSGWKTYHLNKNQAASAALIRIVESSKKEEKVSLLESYVKENGIKTQAVLARFYAAQAATDEGKKDRAIAFYDALAQDADVEPVFRGLADILSVMAQFDNGDPAVLEARLQPLVKDGPWKALASELIGHLALKVGDKPKAKKIFMDLVNTKDISPGIQMRASDLSQWLNGGS